MGRVSVCLSLVVLYSPYVSSLSHFVARACRPDALLPIPIPLRLCSFETLPGVFKEGSLLCPVLSLLAFMERAKSAVSHVSSLFVSPCSPSRQFWVALFVRVQVPQREHLVQYLRGHYLCGFYEDLDCLHGAGSCSLEIKFSFCFILFT